MQWLKRGSALVALLMGFALGVFAGRLRSSTTSAEPTTRPRRAATRTGAKAGVDTDTPGMAFVSAAAAKRGSGPIRRPAPLQLDALSAAQIHRCAGALDLLEGATTVLLEEGEGLMGNGLEELGEPMLRIVSDVSNLANHIRQLGEDHR